MHGARQRGEVLARGRIVAEEVPGCGERRGDERSEEEEKGDGEEGGHCGHCGRV